MFSVAMGKTVFGQLHQQGVITGFSYTYTPHTCKALAIFFFCLLALRPSGGMDNREQLCMHQGQLRRMFGEDTGMAFTGNIDVKSDADHFVINFQIKI